MSDKTSNALLELGNSEVEGPNTLPWVRFAVALTVDSKLAIGAAILPVYTLASGYVSGLAVHHLLRTFYHP